MNTFDALDAVTAALFLALIAPTPEQTGLAIALAAEAAAAGQLSLQQAKGCKQTALRLFHEAVS